MFYSKIQITFVEKKITQIHTALKRRVYDVIKLKKYKIMTELQKKYEKSVNAYIKEFEKRFEIDFDFWIADKVGEVAMFGDYSFDFSDIKFMVDNEFPIKYLFDWFNFVLEFGKNCYINIESYCKLRRDFEIEFPHHNLTDFEKKLLYDRI